MAKNRYTGASYAQVGRRLKRLKAQLKQFEERYGINKSKDATMKLTYWGGWDIGYLKGKIDVLEDLLEDLKPKD